MTLLIWGFLAGIVGSLLMDQAGGYAARRGITTGVDIALVGRWFLGMLRGQFVHTDIRLSPPIENEVRAGWAFHFLVGGGAVALPYPLIFMILQSPVPENSFLPGLLYGLVTVGLLWFIMLPAFGWGMFGKNGPPATKVVQAGLLTHSCYGIGIGAVMTLALKTGLT